MPKLRSVRDPRLSARILNRKPLRYRRGADVALDRPAHVRASSALCWVGGVGQGELVTLQDDAAFLGLVEPATGLVDDVPLPAGPGGRRVFDTRRGNKADKPDFELAFAVDDVGEAGPGGGQLIGLGSGGLAPRQQALRWRRGEAPQLVPLPRLYAQLRAAVVGEANLNFEGGARWGEHVVLANRGGDGGDAAHGGGSPDALVLLPWAALARLLDDAEGAPLPGLQVIEVELGTLEVSAEEGAVHTHLRFTDLAPRPGGLWYLAAAERTDNFYDDGEVVGSALGTVTFGASPEAPPALRFTPIVDERGQIGADKVEGVCGHVRADRLWAVTDPDDPDRPGELLELELTGPW
jgi:hypothetical protein